MTSEEKAKHLMECARYLEDLAAGDAENSYRCRVLREGALALRDKATSRGKKRCAIGQCCKPAAICQDCHDMAAQAMEDAEGANG
jgi:hypothetical protein